MTLAISDRSDDDGLPRRRPQLYLVPPLADEASDRCGRSDGAAAIATPRRPRPTGRQGGDAADRPRNVRRSPRPASAEPSPQVGPADPAWPHRGRSDAARVRDHPHRAARAGESSRRRPSVRRARSSSTRATRSGRSRPRRCRTPIRPSLSTVCVSSITFPTIGSTWASNCSCQGPDRCARRARIPGSGRSQKWCADTRRADLRHSGPRNNVNPNI